MANTIRVYKTDGTWIVKRDGSQKASGKFSTQKEAYLSARKIALNNNLTVTVYYPNGGIKAVINPRNRDEESNCFLTTACVRYYGLRDDCYELETLRHFRDTYLMKTNLGKSAVKTYYEIAPALVKKLEKDKNKAILFEAIFEQIKMACLSIEQGNNRKAHSIYKSAVEELFNRYCK